MNREDWKKRLPLVQAFVEGKEIEVRLPISGEWLKSGYLLFNDALDNYRIKPEPTADDYLVGHLACGLKVGDKVRVTRKAEPYEGGWKDGWSEAMDNTVGKTYTIEKDLGYSGFRTDLIWAYPYFVLEKVEPKYRPFANAEEFAPHRDKWIKEVAIKRTVAVTMFDNFGLWHDGTQTRIAWKEVYEDYTFDDGTPCGVEVDS